MSVTRDWDPMDNDISEGHAAEAQSSHLWGQGLGNTGRGERECDRDWVWSTCT